MIAKGKWHEQIWPAGSLWQPGSHFLRFEFYYNPNFKDELDKGDEAK
jgi:hypothetical protein